MTVAVATLAELRPLRRRLRHTPAVRIERVGVRARDAAARYRGSLLSCGLGGALRDGLEPGTLLVPWSVATTRGAVMACDPALVTRLLDAARDLALPVEPGPLLTADQLVTGAERVSWGERGYAGVDMESALLAVRAPAFAVLRIVLDTPARELSPAWGRPALAMARPRLWREAAWLAREVPALCAVLARVLHRAFAGSPKAPAPDTSAPPAPPGG